MLRHRRATVAVAALFGAPPLMTGVAVVEPVAPSSEAVLPGTGREIVFRGTGGRLFGLRCAATPSEAQVRVPAETTLRVVNRMGRRARLVLDGVARGEVGSGAAAEVLFHRGPVSLTLRPNCLISGGSVVRVDVEAGQTGTVPGYPGAETPRRPSPDGEAKAREVPRPHRFAAEPTAGVAPVRDRGPSGLLALIATVCVVGVSAGAVRAIIAQRATRTIVA